MVHLVPTDKVVQKLHFLPVWLYYGTFGGPLTNYCTNKLGAEIALFASLTVLRYIWWPTKKVGAEITLFASLTVQWYIWWPTNKLGAEIALFTSLAVVWYIWWPNEKSRCRNCTFPQSDCTMVHLVAH